MDALARLGMRLVKDILQLLHPQMVKVQGKWYGGKVAGLQQEDLKSVEGMQWPVGIYCPLQMARALLGCVWVQGRGMG